jgi:hypothetical protein
MRTPLSTLALVAGAALLAASASSGQAGWTLRIEARFEGVVDPASDNWTLTRQVTYATCLKLVNYGSGARSSTLLPEAAPFPRISTDGRRYTFSVRPAFTRFSNGERVGPASFARALVRAARLDHLGVPGARFIEDVVGARRVMEYPQRTIRGVRTPGDRLVIHLRQPASDFLARMALPYFCALPRGVPLRLLTEGERIASAGPYYVARWTEAGPELRRNPHYRGPRTRGPARVVFGARGVRAGHSDWLPAAYEEEDRPLGGARRHRIPLPYTTVLMFGTRPGEPFANRRLRLAAAHAVDRPRLVGRFGVPGDAIVAARPPGYGRVSVYPARRSEASDRRARELAQGLVPTAVYARGIFDRDSRNALAESLGAVGIRVGFAFTADCDYAADLYLLEIPAAYHDPASVFRYLAHPDRLSGCYWPAWFDRGWRPQLTRALRLPGPARLRALAALERRLLLDAEIFGLGQVTQPHLFSARIGCFRPHRAYQVDLGSLCLR